MALDLGAAGAHTRNPPAAGDAPADDGGDRRTTDRLRWLLPLIIVVFAAGLRFAYLSHPERIYFDETYYATNAAQLLDYGVEAEPRVEADPTQGVDPVFVVHPPVGKWLIAAGIAVFGDNSLGWRAAAAVAGTLLVGVTYAIGLRLFRRRGVAALAAFLLSIDGLALTMSRISMLDVFLALFVALGVWALLIDRDHRWALVRRDLGNDLTVERGSVPQNGAMAGTDGDPSASAHAATPALRRMPRMPRPYVWLAGTAFGFALATKWSAGLAIGAAGLYLLASEIAWRRALTGRWHRQLWRAVALGLASLIVLPLGVYVTSYASWFANYERTRPGVAECASTPCEVGPRAIARGWFGEQQDIYRFHRDLEVEHSYRAPAILWPVTRRPVVYYYESCEADPSERDSCAVAPGTVEEIIGLGNPAIWWMALAVYPFLLYAAVRHRDRVAATILVFLLGQYLPWLGPSRPLFFFYALPLVPFVMLALGWAAIRLLPRQGLRWVPVGAGVVALAAFVFWSPVYYGWQITEAAWRMRMWFNTWI
ncbi:MAG: glycosyltransferase family 39 protein [Actinobacteria bacterium]|nr:glycosyltransferase family 39 protein [Actinomycetota bacterium]